MNASTSAQAKQTLDDHTVAAYLSDRPDFFANHPDLLVELELPHNSGGAVSLVERQVSVLRERNIDMRNRLGKLVEAAKTNDRLFEMTRRLVLELLACDTLNKATTALHNSLQSDFKTDFSTLCLFGNPQDAGDYARCINKNKAHETIGNLIDAEQVICGVLRKEETQFLFGEDASDIKSAAVVPFGSPTVIGVLAVGSRDPQHYKSGMGTLFLSYIGEILERAMPKFL